LRTPLERRLASDDIDLVWFPTYIEDVNLPFVCQVLDVEHRMKPWFAEVTARGEFEHRERYYRRYLPKATRVIVAGETGREQVTAALDRLLDQDRTWTAAQLADALGKEGIALSTRQTRKYLGRMGARWLRTVRTLAHKQDPVKVARAEQTLGALKKGPTQAASRSRSSMSVASRRVSP
jgi:hypothetical protein